MSLGVRENIFLPIIVYPLALNDSCPSHMHLPHPSFPQSSNPLQHQLKVQNLIQILSAQKSLIP